MLKIGETPQKFWVVGKILETRAAELPDHPILYWSGEKYTYSQLNKSANQVARGFIDNGIQHSDRVAVMMENSPAYIGVWFGLAKLGAIEVPINTAYKGELLAHIINSSAANIVVIDYEFLQSFESILHSCPSITCIVLNSCTKDEAIPANKDGIKYKHLSLIASGKDENIEHDILPEDIACVMFTSGTTGPSKGVIINNAFELSFAVIFNEIVALKPSDITYNFLPFFHIAGKYIFLGTMFVNGRMVLRPRFSANEFWNDIRTFRATVTVAAGGICQMIYSRTPTSQDSNNPLRMIYSVPNPHDILSEFKNRFGVELTEGYGSTEANIVTYTRLNENTPIGAAGRAAPYYDVRVVDEDDKEVKPGVSGEIVVRPKYPNILMEGYFGLPEKSLKTFKNLWFHSGDRGMMDKDGYLFFLDRMKDAIRRRGENISSFEVERIVGKFPGISEVAAVGVPAEIGEEEVKVVVVCQANSSIKHEDLFEHCIREMPYFMVPRFIEFVNDLPRTATQKVKKNELRDLGITNATWDCEEEGFTITRGGSTNRNL